MKLKPILGSEAHWTINKHLAKTIGLHSTLLLQHLIDLEENYFDGTEFFQSEESLIEKTGLTVDSIRKCKKVLVEHNFIVLTLKRAENSTKISKQHHFTILKENILNFIVDNQRQSKKQTDVGLKNTPSTVLNLDQVDKENNNKENNNKVLDVPSVDKEIKDFYGKIFFKIVEAYPKNRIGNRQHGLKKFSTLTKEEAKLAAINLKRYLAITDGFVKSLQNYITEQCFTEAWLQAEETNQKQKNQKTNDTTNNAKSFTDRNVSFF